MNPIITAGLTSFAVAMATKGAEGPAQTVDDLWFLVFGQWVHPLAEKRRVMVQQKVNAFKKKAIEEASKIPAENIQQPRMAILGPTLEAAKFYYDEDDLRDMFAKLIAASLDSSKNDTIRSSFVEIIKQLEPIDASNLKLFKDSKFMPCVKLDLLEPDGLSSSTIVDFLFASNPDFPMADNHQSSFDNLSRLGLVNVSFIWHLTDDEDYSAYSLEMFDFSNVKIKDGRRPQLTKGVIELTSLGKDFISVCL